MTKYEKVAILAAKRAGKYLAKNFHQAKHASFKSKHEIITVADTAAEKIILDIIKKRFPDHAILSEEAGKNKKTSDYLWVIDPLDGTTNYFMRNPLYAISIALLYKGEAILGVVYAPSLQELYFAGAGKGAFLNNKKIHVSHKNNLKESLLTYCHGSHEKYLKIALKTYQHFKTHGLDLRQLGSASVELGFVAAARTEAIMIPGAKPWDVAAGILLVREAGGRVTDYKGKEWDMKDFDMLASNGLVHQEILKVL